MGSVGNFLFGGGSNNQKNSSSSNEISNSQNQSQNSNVTGSDSTSTSVSGANNQAYGPISAAMTPSLGYLTQAGDMMGALLGLPPSNFSYNTPAPSPLPPTPANPNSGSSLVNSLFNSSPYSPSQTPASAPAPQTAPVVSQTPVPPSPEISPVGLHIPTTGYSTNGDGVGSGIARTGMGPLSYLYSKADGGPIPGAQPTLVGEKGPEVFVPQTAGTVVPNPGSAPNPTSALNTFANSAGEQFLLNQGQQALSGASAANGTFDSGATGKALTQFGQNLGSTYLNDYLGHLSDYAKLGLGGASALTGAGNVTQSVGNSGSQNFGYGSGTSSGSSSLTSNSTSKGSGSGSQKNGLLPDLAAFAKVSPGGG